MKKVVKEKLNNIIENLPDNLTISKDVLNYFGNEATKVIFDDSIKGNYYIFLNDTIYITKNNTTDFSRLTVICHECIHSIQSKMLHMINFILSNIELILFVICCILKLFNIFESIINIIYPIFSLISIIPRIVLENDAIVKSFDLTGTFLKKYNVSESDILYFDNYLKKQTLISKIGNIFSFTFWKLIRTLIIIIV